jgi:hypothetical protein
VVATAASRSLAWVQRTFNTLGRRDG